MQQLLFTVMLVLSQCALANPSFEETRLLELEEEVRTLTGKVELLEYRLKLLQAGQAKGSSSADIADNMGPDIAQMGKRIAEPTLPLGSQPAKQQVVSESKPAEPDAKLMTPAPTPSSTSLLSQYEEAESNQFLAKQKENAAGVKPGNSEEQKQPTAQEVVQSQKPQLKKTKGEREMYEVALASFKDKKYAVAQQRLEEFIGQYPQSSLVSNAYFWLGESYYKQNYSENAAVQYLKSYKAMPTGGKAADALLMLSFALNRIGKRQEACSMLMRLEQEFPKRPASSLKRASDAKLKFACPKP